MARRFGYLHGAVSGVELSCRYSHPIMFGRFPSLCVGAGTRLRFSLVADRWVYRALLPTFNVGTNLDLFQLDC